MIANFAKNVARRNAVGSQLMKKNMGAQQRFITNSYFAIDTQSKDVVEKRLHRFHDEFLSMNWGDTLVCQHNHPFFVNEFERLDSMMGPYVNDPEMGPKWEYTKEAVDAYFACTDCRDFVNDVLELKNRSAGLFNSGWDFKDRPTVDNLPEVVEDIVDNYEKLKKVYPNFKPKIEQTIGHGLAILRMKHKTVDFSSRYRFFF
jgi:hypothetical protein